MTAFGDTIAALHAPFEPWEIAHAPGKGRRESRYVEAAALADRLDAVVGPENWQVKYRQVDRGVECEVSIYFEDCGWISKSNVGGFPGMTNKVKDDNGELVEEDDDENDVKAGYTDSFKRTCAFGWGLGRDYYRKTQRPAHVAAPAHANAPAHAHVPANGEGTRDRDKWGSGQQRSAAPERGGRRDDADGEAPRSGAALFRWAKQQEERGAGGLVKYLDQWAKLQGFARIWKEWDADQVRQGFEEAGRKLQTVGDSGP
jgi:hypothetical protein